MSSSTTNASVGSVQDKMRAAYVKFQGKLQAIRHERLDKLRAIYGRLDQERVAAAKKNLDQL